MSEHAVRHRRRKQNRRGGFTLVELLVVIAIIAILASLITAAAIAALFVMHRFTITSDVTQLATGIENYKSEFGAYPPDCRGGSGNAAVVDDIERHIRSAWPRYTAPGYPGPNRVRAKAAELADQLEPDTALVYFLTRLKPGAANPFPAAGSAPSGNEKSFAEFDVSRLQGSGTTQRYIQAEGGPVPYVYFCSRTYAFSSANPFAVSGAGTIRPYISDQGGFVEPRKYQIIAAGLDGNFGTNQVNKSYPSGANYSLNDNDNVASFSGGTLEDQQP